MDDLDTMLMRLAQAPMPASLDGIEAKVLARIAARPTARVGFGIGAATIAGALKHATVQAQAAMLEQYGKADPEYRLRVEAALAEARKADAAPEPKPSAGANA